MNSHDRPEMPQEIPDTTPVESPPLPDEKPWLPDTPEPEPANTPEPEPVEKPEDPL